LQKSATIDRIGTFFFTILPWKIEGRRSKRDVGKKKKKGISKEGYSYSQASTSTGDSPLESKEVTQYGSPQVRVSHFLFPVQFPRISYPQKKGSFVLVHFSISNILIN
jgi:hypothetical protein